MDNNEKAFLIQIALILVVIIGVVVGVVIAHQNEKPQMAVNEFGNIIRAANCQFGIQVHHEPGWPPTYPIKDDGTYIHCTINND
jgi:hypothetical protein